MFHPVNANIPSPLDRPQPKGVPTQGQPTAGGSGTSVGGGQGIEGAKPGQEMIQLASGGGSGCLMCVGLQSGMIPKEKLEEIKAESFNKIMAHEQAHASAAGSFGGPIHIEYDANGIAVGGHVPIMIPGLNRLNPEESLQAFEQILAAALAPSDPSSQDMAVATKAQDLMGRAKLMMDQKQQRDTLPMPGAQRQTANAPRPAGPNLPFSIAG